MNIEILLALAPYLDDYDAEVLELMVEERLDITEIGDFINKCLTSRQKADILDRIDDEHIQEVLRRPSVKYINVKRYPATVRRAMECYEYVDDLDDESAAWVKQFYHEYYANGTFGLEEEERILNTDELIQEATRNNHSLSRDAFSVSSTLNSLTYLEDQVYELGDDAPEALTWEDLFKVFGYKPAVDKIFNDAVVNVKNAKEERIGIHLLQFYIRMTKLRRMNSRDQKVRGKFNKKEKNEEA